MWRRRQRAGARTTEREVPILIGYIELQSPWRHIQCILGSLEGGRMVTFPKGSRSISLGYLLLHRPNRLIEHCTAWRSIRLMNANSTSTSFSPPPLVVRADAAVARSDHRPPLPGESLIAAIKGAFHVTSRRPQVVPGLAGN